MGTVAQRLQAERLRFPGMLPDEILVFRAWLRIHEREYDRFDYNLRVGKGEDPGPTFALSVREMAVSITQLRLDAVGWRGGAPAIIEVKRRAGPSNVGQLLTYKAAWVEEARSATAPALILVCSAFTPNILPIVRETGIMLDVVSVDFSELKTAGIPGTRRFTGRA